MLYNKLNISSISYSIALAALLITQIQANFIRDRSTSSSSSSSSSTARKTAEHSESTISHHSELLFDELDKGLLQSEASNKPHSRKKRLIWITDDGRLALPPGTTLTITPTIALPLVRYPPEGFFSNLTMSFPVTIDFDKLGLTDNQNPLGDLPPLFARSAGRAAGHMLGDYVSQYLHSRTKRDLINQDTNSNTNYNNQLEEDDSSRSAPVLPDQFKHVFHGGERVLLYGIVEDFLATFGMNGKACLLRTICEMHSRNLENFGVLGEMAKLFFTVTKSPFFDLMPEYVRAQSIGEGKEAPGECFPYYKECPKSIFKALNNHNYRQPEPEENELSSKVKIPQKQKSWKLKIKKPHVNEALYSM